jgi:hypothetical protein
MQKWLSLSILLVLSHAAFSQSIDSLFVHLYTDSLKKGTFNYINVDGKLSNGQYYPLDSTQVKFTTTLGEFYGNNLWIDAATDSGTAEITVTLLQDLGVSQTFKLSIKQLPDGPLKTADEVLQELKSKPPSSKKSRSRQNNRQ